MEEGNKDANERSRASMLEEGILLKNISVPSRITKIVEQLETNDTVVYLLSTSARLVFSKHSFVVEGIEISVYTG